MKLKKHHKWIIGGSSVIIIFMITISIFTYMIFVRQELNYNLLGKKITDLKIETNTNINSLSEGLIQTNEDLGSLSSRLGIIHEEFGFLKASVGADFSGVVENSVPSVVTIRTDVSQGTGFIVEERGYIVTNAHVLTDGTLVNVITYEQEIIEADLVGYDTTFDIALLKIPGTHDTLKFGNSENVQVGEKVIAIGNPLGLQFSVSEGIISAIHRQGPNGLDVYIQTDAALNSGNSGGPLINNKGVVVGINNFKIGGSESLGFALESNFIKFAINEIYQKAFNESLI
ncbi:MAG TPA: trypsin-like serine protease [Candidatus Pacearchaeota archaeon]|nr:trypsin-like serine protease [Candidatus Pacearchaeota archaeon]